MKYSAIGRIVGDNLSVVLKTRTKLQGIRNHTRKGSRLHILHCIKWNAVMQTWVKEILFASF